MTRRFIDICLRGAGQVMFQNDPRSGALFLAALGWGALAAGVPYVMLGGLSALAAATAAAMALRADDAALRAGLCSYNAILIGMAVTYFLGPGLPVLAYAVLGGMLSALAMLGPMNAARPWIVSAHTYPFVLITRLLLLAAQAFAGLPAIAPPVPETGPIASDPLDVGAFVGGMLHSISQVFFKGNTISALLLLAGLAVRSFAAAGFALGGALLAVATAHVFGVESELISSGIQGFSPVLTAIAFGTVFYRPSWRTALFAALATVVTVVAQAALKTALAPLALQPLSAPFDVVAWVLLVPRRYVEGRGR